MNTFSGCSLAGAILVVGLTLGTLSPAAAQNVDGNVGLGGQLGEPAGITMKFHNSGSMSYDFLAAFDLDDFFYLNVHGLFERPISDPDGLNVVYGPGAFIGIYDRPRTEDDDLALGISGQIGLNYYIEQFEIFARITPRIEILPATSGDVGGGFGFRYYF